MQRRYKQHAASDARLLHVPSDLAPKKEAGPDIGRQHLVPGRLRDAQRRVGLQATRTG